MTRKVFGEDPYRTSLEATLLSVVGNAVTLDQTIFYAFSGGQERDTGTIAGRTVLDAQHAGREMIYTLGDASGLQPGEQVLVTIDWPRRYALMRLHFAAEIVLELCYRALPGAEKVGAHIAADKARLDFVWSESLAPPNRADHLRRHHPNSGALAALAAHSGGQPARRGSRGLRPAPGGGGSLRPTPRRDRPAKL
ncbi:MAG: alanyl-tRNA editing protein [Chloroflexales bacterium]|nr:alanyl-tRNA editing protein [Chloroflexales bacterium]